jgi:hypothetical protein
MNDGRVLFFISSSARAAGSGHPMVVVKGRRLTI